MHRRGKCRVVLATARKGKVTLRRVSRCRNFPQYGLHVAQNRWGLPGCMFRGPPCAYSLRCCRCRIVIPWSSACAEDEPDQVNHGGGRATRCQVEYGGIPALHGACSDQSPTESSAVVLPRRRASVRASWLATLGFDEFGRISLAFRHDLQCSGVNNGVPLC
jgi:hypothetical protein